MIGKNHLYVAETDYDLRIVDFLEIDEPDQLRIVWDLPQSVAYRKYAVGALVPIPLGVYDRCVVIYADERNLSALLPLQSDMERRFVESINKLIENVRSGHCRSVEESIIETDFKIEFDDVLTGEPVHSRHWVARVKLAWTSLGQIPATLHGGFQGILREKCRQWWQQFSRKSDSKLLLQILEFMILSCFPENQLADQLVEMLQYEAAIGELKLFQSDRLEPMIINLFPKGLYSYFYGNARKNSAHDRTSIDLMLWFNRNFDQLSEVSDYYTLWRISIAMFGSGDPPAGDLDKYRNLHRNEVASLETSIRHDLTSFFKEHRNASQWADRAESYLVHDNDLKFLRRVYDGLQRSIETSQDDVGGISHVLRGDLDLYTATNYFIDFRGRNPIQRSRSPRYTGLSDRAVDWLTELGPLDRFEADLLLSASYGEHNSTYRGKLKHHRLELERMPSQVLVVKGREKISRFRNEIILIRKRYDKSPM